MNQKGFSLVEVMIALVILLLVSMGLFQTALLSIDSNMLNVQRDHATSINQELMAYTQTVPFDDMNNDGAVDVSPLTLNDEKHIQLAGDFKYITTITITSINDDTKRIDSTVSWTWKDRPYAQTMSTIRKRDTT